MSPHTSDVAHLRQHVADEETAARRGLSGLALSARHEFITARATRGATRILALVEQGRIVEAQALMDSPNWGVDEEEARSLFPGETIHLQHVKGDARP